MSLHQSGDGRLEAGDGRRETGEGGSETGDRRISDCYGQSIVGAGIEEGTVSAQLALYDPDSIAAVEPSERFSLAKVVERYLEATNAAAATQAEYRTTVNRWRDWCELQRNLHRCYTPMQVTSLDYEKCKAFLDWCFDAASAEGAKNPGRVHNKHRAHLSAVFRWLADPESGDGVEISSVPTLPKPREQRSEAGHWYLEESEINAIYWQTYSLTIRGFKNAAVPVGAYWRAALVFFYNYGVDTGTVFPYLQRHQPLLWRHVFASPTCPDRSIKLPEELTTEFGWIHYKRTKTGKSFVRPMNRVVQLHLDSIRPAGDPESYAEQRVFLGGTARPTERFRLLWQAAKVPAKIDPETGEPCEWVFKDLRKTSATWHDANVPGSGSPILGHAIEGSAKVTSQHYSSGGPLLAARSLLTLPQPEAFRSIYDDSIKPPAMLFVK